MKGIPNITTLLFFVVSFTLSSLSVAQEMRHPASPEKEYYELRISKANDLHADQMEILARQYTTALKNSVIALQKAGNLDGLIAAKAELKRFNKEESVPAKSPEGTHTSVLKLRKIFTDSRAKADALKVKAISESTRNYLVFLNKLQKKLTQGGKIMQALEVKNEVTKILKFKAGIPAVEEPNRLIPQEVGKKPESLLLAWDCTKPSVLLRGGKQVARGYKLKQQGGNGILKDGSLSLIGGRTTVEGLSGKLVASCKATQQWSLVLHFETSSLDQSGPARIFSSSQDGYMRNFSLCQEKDQLVLRLRTTATGENGTKPEVKLGQIKKGKLHRIAITYEPGKLGFFMDGKAIAVKQISGNFSNWKEYQLVLGNEWKDDRPWRGKFSHFSLYCSTLTKTEGVAHTR
ncbi:MAG: LamG-like jellyroll fold domain-containing protein [Akkermansiaceae bacterium]